MANIIYFWEWMTAVEVIMLFIIAYLWVVGFFLIKDLMYPPYPNCALRLEFHQYIVLVLWPLVGMLYILGFFDE